jgi:hypothetical protein
MGVLLLPVLVGTGVAQALPAMGGAWPGGSSPAGSASIAGWELASCGYDFLPPAGEFGLAA